MPSIRLLPLRPPRRLSKSLRLATASLVLGAVSLWGSAGTVKASAASAVPTLSILAGNGTTGPVTPGPATSTSIGEGLSGGAFDPSGDAYFGVDSSNQFYVYRVTPSGTISVFAGNGTEAKGVAGPATSSPVGRPLQLASDSAGNLYIADDQNGYVYKVTPDGTLSIYAGDGADSPTAVKNGSAATSAPIGNVQAVATDSGGDVFVGTQNSYVYKVTPGGTLTIFAGDGVDAGAEATPGSATATAIGDISGLATDPAGDVYISDAAAEFVYKVTPSGTLSVIAGADTSSGPVDGTAATAHNIGDVAGLAVDKTGDVFLADDSNGRVYEVDPAGILHFYGGDGNTSTAPTPGPATASPIASPEGLAINPVNDDLLVNDDFAGINQGPYQLLISPVAPSPVTDAVAVVSNGTIRVSWNAPTSGSPAATYTVTPYVNGVAQSPVTGLATTSYTVTSPVGGATYSFAVQAVNAGGSSAAVTSNTVQGPGEGGYLLAASDGGVFAFGDAAFHGSLGNVKLREPIEGITPTADDKGYWMVASDGGVFAFGDAAFHGSLGNVKLRKPIVGIAVTPTGSGYWMVASDGGVFAFGDAAFYGSLGAKTLAAQAVNVAPTPDGRGYFILLANGAVYGFGDAAAYSSAAIPGLVKPMVGIGSTSSGHGDWTVASDGGIFAHGDADFYGSLGKVKLRKPIVAFAPTINGLGYLLTASDGGLFAFGDAAFYGSLGNIKLAQPIVGIAVTK